MTTNGATVSAFERAFAEYVGARYAIAAANGTVTLQAALVALGVKPGDRVATTPLTMSATSIAVLNVGAVPVFFDIEPDTWLININGYGVNTSAIIPVSLYGLQCPSWRGLGMVIDDAAQTLRKHGGADFTSYSFQASKILALGEGGMLVTDDEGLAEAARSYLSLGYQMSATQARIDSQALRSPTFGRHHRWPSVNGRMNDLTAAEGLGYFEKLDEAGHCGADFALSNRRKAAALYAQSIAGCDWLTPQKVPEGWTHDYWCWTAALADSRPPLPFNLVECYPTKSGPDAMWHRFADAIVRHGGERPYAAWRLTFTEPAFAHLAPFRADPSGFCLCPVAQSLQPRLMQFQTNNLASAEKNAEALRRAIREVGG